MSSAPTLNTFAAPQWAAVVSGVAWKAYTLAPDGGAVSVEVMRAPVIVWAKGGGEEEAVKLATPMPSPLEVRAAGVNAAPHFQRFRWAARGKVRPSVRWKTRRRRVVAAYLAFVKGCVAFSPMSWPTCLKSYRMAFKRHRSRQAQKKLSSSYRYSRRWLNSKGAEGCAQDSKTYFGIASKFNETVQAVRRVHREFYDFNFLSDELDWDIPEDEYEVQERAERQEWDGPHIRHLGGYVACEYHFSLGIQKGFNDWVNLSLVDPAILKDLIKDVRKPAALIIFLKALAAAIYRAHLARRVRPPVRRTRVRRPLYARPRPPTCPLAPPVA